MRLAPQNSSLLESIVSLIIIGIFAGVLAFFLHQAAIKAKETALRAELVNLRQALLLYKASKGDYPEGLNDLIRARHRFPGTEEFNFGENFLGSIRTDAKGFPVDPYKNRYDYNPVKGVIKSATKGYEEW